MYVCTSICASKGSCSFWEFIKWKIILTRCLAIRESWLDPLWSQLWNLEQSGPDAFWKILTLRNLHSFYQFNTLLHTVREHWNGGCFIHAAVAGNRKRDTERVIWKLPLLFKSKAILDAFIDYRCVHMNVCICIFKSTIKQNVSHEDCECRLAMYAKF